MNKKSVNIFKKILKNKKGMTMPEIMAGVMVMTIMASAGAVNVLKNLDQVRITATVSEMLSIRDALLNYQRDNPGETASSLSTLVTNDYLMEGVDEAPDIDMETDYDEDAWNENYVKVWPTSSARGSLTSSGPDKDIATTSDNIVVALEKIVE